MHSDEANFLNILNIYKNKRDILIEFYTFGSQSITRKFKKYTIYFRNRL